MKHYIDISWIVATNDKEKSSITLIDENKNLINMNFEDLRDYLNKLECDNYYYKRFYKENK